MCPAIFETKCGNAVPACPTVAKFDDKYVVIGKRVTSDDYPDLHDRIGPGEAAVEISADLVEEALQHFGG